MSDFLASPVTIGDILLYGVVSLVFGLAVAWWRGVFQ